LGVLASNRRDDFTRHIVHIFKRIDHREVGPAIGGAMNQALHLLAAPSRLLD
jgi:hypothetical protein